MKHLKVLALTLICIGVILFVTSSCNNNDSSKDTVVTVNEFGVYAISQLEWNSPYCIYTIKQLNTNNYIYIKDSVGKFKIGKGLELSKWYK
jgi:hypothetical protein